MEFYKLKMFRFGGGITYHIRPSLDGDGVVDEIGADFDNALGFVLQSDILFGYYYAGLRYTAIEYEVEGHNADVGGNSVGVLLGFRF